MECPKHNAIGYVASSKGGYYYDPITAGPWSLSFTYNNPSVLLGD